MTRNNSTLLTSSALLLLGLATVQSAKAQDEVRDQFNPVRTGVTSLSVAPDARAGGMGDWVLQPTPMHTHNIGIQPNFPSPYHVQA